MQKDIHYFKTQNLSVGHNGKVLIEDINIEVKRGEILTLIGPNGSGKSTILKSITKHISSLGGVVYIDSQDIGKLSNKEVATKLSVVLTERVAPELMTCYEVVSAGRYPYTNSFGLLTKEDKEIVYDSLDKVHAIELKDKDFNELSDGQKQRIMLARAICQQPEVIVLDEPTSFLDIRHKIELLDILRNMAREKNITVIMSLHEIDLAPKIADTVVCVKGDRITRFGRAEDVFKAEIINELYDISSGSYNMLFGSVELSKPTGKPEIFVISGNGTGANTYRLLQKKNTPFNTGILFENDVDYFVASPLAEKVFSQKAFTDISDDALDDAFKSAMKASYIILTIKEFGKHNRCRELVDMLIKSGKTIYHSIDEIDL